MKKILIMAAMVLVCTSCFHVNSNWKGGIKFNGKNVIKGEGPVIEKSFDLKDFDQIVLNGFADVAFVQADSFEVKLRSQENIFDHLDFRVEGTKLILETKDQATVRAEEFDVTVKAPQLKSFTVNGAGDFDLKDGLRMDEDFEIDLNGSGDLNLNGIVVPNLTVTVNGAGDVDLTSIDIAKALKVVVRGAGDVNVTGKTQDASFEVTGAGDIDARGLTVAGDVSRHTAGMAKIQM